MVRERRRRLVRCLAGSAALLWLAHAAPAAAQECPPTAGGAFVEATRRWLSQGDMQDFTSAIPPAGIQMRIHHRADPPPHGAFAKLPTGVDFDIAGADQFNRFSMLPAVVESDWFLARLNDIRATRLERFDLTCASDFMGSDLSGGALRADLHFEPRRVDEAVQIHFRSDPIKIELPPRCIPYPVIGFNRWGIPVVRWREACTPRLTLFNERIQFEIQDLDMRPFTVKVAVKPQIFRGESILLVPIVDAREVGAAVPLVQWIDAVTQNVFRIAYVFCAPAALVGLGGECMNFVEDFVIDVIWQHGVSLQQKIQNYVADQVWAT